MFDKKSRDQSQRVAEKEFARLESDERIERLKSCSCCGEEAKPHFQWDPHFRPTETVFYIQCTNFECKNKTDICCDIKVGVKEWNEQHIQQKGNEQKNRIPKLHFDRITSMSGRSGDDALWDITEKINEIINTVNKLSFGND